MTVGYGTSIWSADGNFNVTADGFPGWSADGYEPTDLFTATVALAAAGLNVGTLTYRFSTNGTPLGYVITGYPALINFGSIPPGSYVPLVLSLGPAPIVIKATVPNVIGKYYFDAQQALLAARLLIAPPIWVLPGVSPVWTADSTSITADSDIATAGNPILQLPGYVINQSISPTTQVPEQTQVVITVVGFPVVNQTNVVVPVP